MKMHVAPFSLRELKLEVTHTCLLSCIHCSSMAEAESTRIMRWEDCRRIVSEAAALHVEEIAISGGEPLLWSHLVEAVSLATKNNIEVSLYTTGNAPKASFLFQELKRAGLKRVMFSLFGKSQACHEAITLVKGSFYSTVESVKICLDLGFQVEFHFVPMADNYTELRSITQFAKKLGVSRVSVLRLVPQGRGVASDRLELNMEANKSLRNTIVDLRNEGFDVRLGSPYNFLLLREKPECCSGIDRLTVSPDLKISPCDAFKQISPEMIGVANEFSNLSGHSLLECWEKSPYLNKVREYLTTPFAQNCDSCNQLDSCLSGCLAQKFYSSGALTKAPDPMCLFA